MMPKLKIIISSIVAIIVVAAQVGTVFAAPDRKDSGQIHGTVHSITLETNSSTGITTVEVTLKDKKEQTVRISLETALKPELGLVVLDSDGNPRINPEALGQWIEIDPTVVIPDEEVAQHPVASALAIFFSEIPGMDYATILASHDEGGFGFGVIAQALWLTTKLPDGNSDVFAALLEAKALDDYSGFLLSDGTEPKSWGQLRNAILNSENCDLVEKCNPGVVMSDMHNESVPGSGNGNGQQNGLGIGKDKEKDKENNGHGHENGR